MGMVCFARSLNKGLMKKYLLLLPLVLLAASCREQASTSSVSEESTPESTPIESTTPSVSIPDIDTTKAFTSLRADVLAFKGQLNYKVEKEKGTVLQETLTSIESIFADGSYSYLREYDENGTIFLSQDYADEEGYAYTYDENGEQAYYVYEEDESLVKFTDLCPPMFKMLASSLAHPQADGTLLLTFGTNEVNYQYKLEILALLTGRGDLPTDGDFVFTLTDGVIDGGSYTASQTGMVKINGINTMATITAVYDFDICDASDIDFTPNFAE